MCFMVALQALQFDCKDCVQYQHVQFLCDLQTRAAQLADLVDPASVLEAFHFNFEFLLLFLPEERTRDPVFPFEAPPRAEACSVSL